MKKKFHLGLLYLIHLLIGVDGKLHENELETLNKIKFNEKIDSETLSEFASVVGNNKERDIFKKGIDFLNECTREEKLKAFVTLYKMSEVDGRVHVKEIRLLLYSIEIAGIDFDDVVTAAKEFQGFN